MKSPFNRPGDTGGEYWISVSDLMAGLMMVFLFISVALMLEVTDERDRIKEVAKTYQNTQLNIYHDLKKEFEQDFDDWGAELDKATLSINFIDPRLLFHPGKATLTPRFKKILENFIPRYLAIVERYHDSIIDVRIEGHTSSDWKNQTDRNAYLHNMELSQVRSLYVLSYIMHMRVINNTSERYNWVKSHFSAVGYSSSKLIYKDIDHQTEDKVRSRRVTFRIITDSEEQIQRILEQ